jgi:acyl carrier protein
MEVVELTIKTHIQQMMSGRSRPQLASDTPLIEGGYLTSLDTVDLVLFLEEKFGVQIDPEEVTEEEFHSLRTIAGLVSRKLPQSKSTNGR